MSLNVLTQGGGAGGEFASIFVTGLSEADSVTATKDGKTVNGKWAPKPIHREGFTVLEYIKSTGAQYIDALLQTTGSLRFWVDFSIENEISANDIGTVFGMRSSGIWEEAYDYALNTYPNFSGGTFQVGHVSVPSENVSADPKIVPNKRCQISYLGNTFTAADGTTTELAPQSFNASYTLFLFAKHIVNDVGEFGKVTLYRAKFYDGSALVRDFVPMRRNADGVVGLYDVVNDVFYTDGRNGAFIAGSESPQYSYCHKMTIKEYGMWTVTASNGEETITQDVLVDAAVEYEIEMLFRLYLYREGDECEEVTGGWVAQGLGWEAAYNVPSAPTLTKNESNMAVSRTNASSYECGIILPRNKIDLTGYKTINAVVDYSMINAACMFAGFIRSSLGSVCIDGDRWFRMNNANNPTSKALVSYDISSYDGLFVLYFALYSTGNGAIHKLWLE